MSHVSGSEVKYCHRFVQVGRSFFTPPRDQILDLGDGLELWYGFFQSAILGWKPFVNIDGEYIDYSDTGPRGSTSTSSVYVQNILKPTSMSLIRHGNNSNGSF
jgi:hypothetical protein